MSPDLAHREPAERPDPTSCPAQAAVLIDPGPRLAKGRLVGRALMTLPKLLMLDEPSLGLAPLIVKEIFHTIAEINRAGSTVLLVEQNTRQALALSRRGYVVENGSVALVGSGEELLGNEHVRRAYLGL